MRRHTVTLPVLLLTFFACTAPPDLDEDGDGFLRADESAEDDEAVDVDCNDQDPLTYPGAPDPRGDGCDSDCGAALDTDGDDWPDSVDCDPNDPTVHPCSDDEVAGDTVDSDCDGNDGVRTDGCPTLDPDYTEAEQEAWVEMTCE